MVGGKSIARASRGRPLLMLHHKAMLPTRQTEFNLGPLPWNTSRQRREYEEVATGEHVQG